MVKNDSRKTQKLIIPQGTIDSMDTTIIEIPVKLHDEPIVVAKKKESQKSIAFDDEEFVSQLYRTARNRNQSENQGTDIKRSSNFEPKLSSTSRGQTYGVSKSTELEDAMLEPPSTLLSEQNSSGGITYGSHQRNAGYGLDGRKFDPILNFALGPNRMVVPTTSQMSGRYNFHTNIPQQSVRITCDIADGSAEIDEIEKAERSLILGELQKYHDARRKYLTSFCDYVDVPCYENRRPSSVCVRKSFCSVQDPPAPKICVSTTRAGATCPKYHRTRESSATSLARGSKHSGIDVACDPCLKEVQERVCPTSAVCPEIGRLSSASNKCIPTILTTSDIQKIRQQFQDATIKLEKAMACVPCNK